jgi:branched-chain amino acid transport system substrate-binding protein
MENAANQRFVSGFREKYGRYPSFYAAQAYDSMFLIKSAADALNGDLSDTAATRDALQAANFESVRGDFTFGNNHFPIQDFFSREVVVDDEGNWTTAITNRVMEDHVDSYAAECSL